MQYQKLSLTNARSLVLLAQGLFAPHLPKANKQDLLNIIKQMGALQIDTINVIARSPYLVLWSRLGDYPLNWLDELLEERKIFEYWSHAACFLPIEDYPLYRRLMLDTKSSKRDWPQMVIELINDHPEIMEVVLERIRQEGALCSADFKRQKNQPGGWWNRKLEKLILEHLYDIGELMIAKRYHFQRYYDLQERIMPDWNDEQTPTYQDVTRHLASKAVRCLGITPTRWVADYFRLKLNRDEMTNTLESLANEGELYRVVVEDWQETAFIHRDNEDLLDIAMDPTIHPSLTTLLSPFDPLIWDRTRAKELFNFDYKIECYTPEKNRKYGYFSLPILWQGKLVGRLDAKAHRKKNQLTGDPAFEIKSLHMEPKSSSTDEMIMDIAAAIHRCALWHQTPQIIIRQTNPAPIASRLRAALKKIN